VGGTFIRLLLESGFRLRFVMVTVLSHNMLRNRLKLSPKP
jgi:hypothetical protein